MEFITVQVLQTLNLMLNMSIHWSKQLSRYVFPNIIECNNCNNLNIQKRPLNIKQMDRVKNIGTEICK